MRLPFPRSLRFRLLAVSLLIEAIMLSLLIGNSVRLIEAYLTHQAEVRIQTIETAYKTALAVPLASRDYPNLRDVLEGWKGAEDIAYLAVADSQGQTLVSIGWDIGKPLPSDNTRDFSAEVVHVSFPVEYQGVVYGRAYYGLSPDFLQRAKAGLFEQSLLIAFIELSLTLLLLFVTGYWLTRDFAKLAEVSGQVASGRFDVRVPMHGNDEVTAVARSFNDMAAAIEQRLSLLAESEQRFRAIADYTYAWESWFGPDGHLRWVNPAVERMTGYAVRDCMNMVDFPMPLVHPADREMLRRHQELALAGCTGQDLEFRVQTRDGRTLWIAMAWQPIYADNGDSLGYRASLRDITLQHNANEELAYAAEHDSLTGLFNRSAFETELASALSRIDLRLASLSVFYIDLDQFKLINDTCGHVAGDALLMQLARVMETRFSYGFLARLGGDEFGMILTGLDVEEAERRAQHIIDDIRGIVFTWEGRSFRIGASIGIAFASPGMLAHSELMIAADTACFAAKERGRNRVQLFIPDDDYFRQRKADFLSLTQIADALTNNRLEVCAQRILPLHPGIEAYAEVLVLMRGEDGTHIPPGRFIPAAERYGMMPLIDRWVIEAVCTEIARAREAGLKTPCLHINLSGSTLADPGLTEFIQAMMANYQVAPSQIGFEITESCAIAQLDLALAFIDFCHDIGCDLSLDDFGSGLSSFGYLKQFKVNGIKIDGMFVRHCDQDADDQAVIESIVSLAQRKGLHTVAEFVCSEAVLETVRRLGADYAQGYHLHQPEPLARVLGLPGAN